MSNGQQKATSEWLRNGLALLMLGEAVVEKSMLQEARHILEAKMEKQAKELEEAWMLVGELAKAARRCIAVIDQGPMANDGERKTVREEMEEAIRGAYTAMGMEEEGDE